MLGGNESIVIIDESMGEQIHVVVSESSQVGDARRKVTALALRAGLDETRVAGKGTHLASPVAGMPIRISHRRTQMDTESDSGLSSMAFICVHLRSSVAKDMARNNFRHGSPDRRGE